MRSFLVALALGGMIASPATAQQAPPAASVTASPALTARAQGLIELLKGQGDYDSYFSAPFRAQVPQAQFAAISKQLTAQFGTPTSIDSLTPTTPFAAVVKVAYERGIVTMKLVVDPADPHTVTGLLITGTEARGDSIAKLDADFRALPGEAGFGIYALDGGVKPVSALNGDRAAPLGSAFKLWVLAELSREIGAGERHWSDVVPLTDQRSLPSGMTQAWPKGAPMTLQTLATLMISISDNTATDTLVNLLGREKIERMVATVGVVDPGRNRPFLSTRDAFALKALGGGDPLVRNWASASPDGRAAGFAAAKDRLAAAKVEVGMFEGGLPLAQQVEWFASPADMARTLDWLRIHGDDTTRAILGVNPGTTMAGQFAYLGFKGGSEPGVLTLNYLVRTKAGRWFAVTGNWHRGDAEVETLTLTGLMNRALALVPQD